MTFPSNGKFDLQGVSLSLGLQVASEHWKYAEGWDTHISLPDKPVPRFVLFWNWKPGADWNPFPVKTPVTDLEPVIRAWLTEQDYGPEPDLDGSIDKGCRVYCETWGTIDRNPYAFVAIEPFWNEYGK